MKSDSKISSANIKAFREASGLTQKEFAQLHGTNQKVQWTYEQGKSLPSSSYTLSLSRKYGFDPELLASLKFRFSKDGRILNIPKKRDELSSLKSELTVVLNEFDEYTRGFISKISAIKERIQTLENKYS